MSTRALTLLLAVLALLAASLEPAHAAKRVALVIGNSAYEQVTRLPNPVRDARAVAAALKRLGFAVTLKLDQDYSQLRRTLGAFSRAAAGADVAAMFYAGHGIEVGGQNYLLPTDAKLTHANDVDFEAIPLATAMGALENANGLKLVILDACRNNPFAARMARVGATRAVGRGLARVSPRGSDTLVAYAAKEGTTADDGAGAHSPYTAALLKHLETPGLEIRLLFGRVRDSVLDSTGKRQEPFTYGSLGGRAIYLKGGGAQQAPAPQNAGELAALQTRLKELEDRLKQQTERPRNEPRVAIGVFPEKPKAGRHLKPGDEFQECDACPKMVVVPAGQFMMGSPASEKERGKDEGPRHKVRIPRAFAVGKFEVTFAEWDVCVADGGCDGYWPSDEGWGRGRRPVIEVSWDAAKTYVAWLARKTGTEYRLLSESEWEYAARAGTTTPFSTGRRITPDQANFDGNYIYNGSRKGRYRKKTVSVGSFRKNAFGLHDMHGNIWEWVEDCWNDTYRNAPSDGRSRTGGDCSFRVLRGGSWDSYPRSLRSAYRSGSTTVSRSSSIGFRVARTLTPAELSEAKNAKTPKEETKVAIGIFPKKPKPSAKRQFNPGDEFQDCDDCPKMVVVPAGQFMMGSPKSEKERYEDEGPRHKVRIPRAFAVGKFEVTRAQFEVFVNDMGHDAGNKCNTYYGRKLKEPSGRSWRKPLFSYGGDHPVTCVNWDDAKAYVEWLARKTGKSYRLLSEAEWEYAARAGTTTPFSTGQRITTDQANFDGNYTYNGSRKGRFRRKTVSVGSFGGNAFGLHDLHGNVWEWVEDCWNDSYWLAPSDGRSRTSDDCSLRVLRGSSWNNTPRYLRSAIRSRFARAVRNGILGFRVARTLTP